MNATLTTTDLANGLHWHSEELAPAKADGMHQVNVFPALRGQTFAGFGGAFTEAAAHSWQQLTPANRQRFLDACFGPDGLGYTLGRAHIGSCDFALGNYACLSAPDETLAGFDISRDEQYLLPLIAAAQQTAGRRLGLLLSPWSPPAFMKTNGEMNHGGKLKPEYRALWAACMAGYVRRYRDAGCDVRMVSVQNEPAATQTWDSCLYTAREEGEFAAQYLRPALDKAGCGDVKILAWDHNKELLVQRAAGTLAAEGADKAVDGFGVHWYSGDHFEAIAAVRALYPGKEVWFTEGCVEYSRFDGMPRVGKAEMYAHDILGNLNAGIAGSLDWNLLLDAAGGPNHVGNFCEAPLMLTADGSDFLINGEYWYIGQFSRFIRPGATALGHSAYTAGLEATAFLNADGRKAAVLLNRTGGALDASLTEDGVTGYNFTLAPHTIATVTY